jgi:hypothetical protein
MGDHVRALAEIAAGAECSGGAPAGLLSNAVLGQIAERIQVSRARKS